MIKVHNNAIRRKRKEEVREKREEGKILKGERGVNGELLQKLVADLRCRVDRMAAQSV